MVDWDVIVATHGPEVWRTAYRLLGRHDDALDCCQETFLAAYRAASRGPIGDWASFLTTLAARKAIDRLRQRTGRRGHNIPLEDVPEPVAPGASPVDRAEWAERLEQVRRLLADLPARQAAVFWLSSVEGLSHTEISRQLGITGGLVRVLLHRARARLRAALEESSPGLRREP
jgi:RNA polymerase sigma-70 factor (ECF subfamily)